MRIQAIHLQPGDKISEGKILRVIFDGDRVVFYLEEETGGFMLKPDDEIEVDRTETK